MQEQIKQILKSNGFSATKTRVSVFNQILALQPVTMNQLISASRSADRATVYRTVDLLIDLGIAKKVSSGFKYRVELSDNFQEHHHHLTCVRCGSVTDITPPAIEAAITSAAQENGFRPLKHELEISGYCANCS